MKIVKGMKAAIDAVNAGAVAVYEDTYLDQIVHDYHILETAEELAEFERLVRQVKDAEGWRTIDALGELEKFVGRPCLPEFLSVLYTGGKWRWDPKGILKDETSLRLQEEDREWFAAEREYFAEMEDPTPIVPDKPWRRKVTDLATKIAAREGRAPEEADFNTAMLQLRDEIPPEQLRILQEDLRAIEEGRSTAHPWG